jgi:hypothetical protein
MVSEDGTSAAKVLEALPTEGAPAVAPEVAAGTEVLEGLDVTRAAVEEAQSFTQGHRYGGTWGTFSQRGTQFNIGAGVTINNKRRERER